MSSCKSIPEFEIGQRMIFVNKNHPLHRTDVKIVDSFTVGNEAHPHHYQVKLLKSKSGYKIGFTFTVYPWELKDASIRSSRRL